MHHLRLIEVSRTLRLQILLILLDPVDRLHWECLYACTHDTFWLSDISWSSLWHLLPQFMQVFKHCRVELLQDVSVLILRILGVGHLSLLRGVLRDGGRDLPGSGCVPLPKPMAHETLVVLFHNGCHV